MENPAFENAELAGKAAKKAAGATDTSHRIRSKKSVTGPWTGRTMLFQQVTDLGFNIIKDVLTFIKGRFILLFMEHNPRSANAGGRQAEHPLYSLSPEELDLVLRLVLASGSLKELAHGYGVSYPTIRARVDRLIARLQTLIDGMPTDPMNELLADLVERGEMTYSAAVAIRDLYRKQKQKGESS